jgi:hypothetical protein
MDVRARRPARRHRTRHPPSEPGALLRAVGSRTGVLSIGGLLLLGAALAALGRA